jgi:hypothetical protein
MAISRQRFANYNRGRVFSVWFVKRKELRIKSKQIKSGFLGYHLTQHIRL